MPPIKTIAIAKTGMFDDHARPHRARYCANATVLPITMMRQTYSIAR